MVDIKLLQYKFRFKPLTWREEFSLGQTSKDYRRRVLIKALVEISGLPVKSVAEATRVVEALPLAIAERAFILYKGSLIPDRTFTTVSLYQAPEPTLYNHQVSKQEEELPEINVAEQRAEALFGKAELEEAKKTEKQILQGAKTGKNYRGAKAKGEPNAS